MQKEIQLKKEGPLVSIIMPAYNAEKYIDSAIESIINQTYVNWELLIADDGSTDNSKEIIRRYTLKDSRIKSYPNEKNIGYLKTCNKLFQLVNGEYITFQDADDLSIKYRIEMQVSFLEKNQDYILVGTNSKYFLKDINNILYSKIFSHSHGDILENLFHGNQFCGASVMFCKNLFEDIGYYQEYFNRIGNEDYDYFFRAAQIHKVSNIPEFMYFVRIAKNSISRNIKSEKQLISDKLVRFLANQRKAYGLDSLSGLDERLLSNYEALLLSEFNKDNTLFFRKIADQFSYQGLKKEAFLASLKGFFKNPFLYLNTKYVGSTLIDWIKNKIYHQNAKIG